MKDIKQEQEKHKHKHDGGGMDMLGFTRPMGEMQMKKDYHSDHKKEGKEEHHTYMTAASIPCVKKETMDYGINM